MKFTCIRNYILDAASATEKIIEKNTALPILQNILIRSDKTTVTLSATNLEIGIHASFKAKIHQSGSFTVPARALFGFLTCLEDEKVSLQKKGTTLVIDAGSHRAGIKGIDEKDFPIIPDIKSEISFSLPTEEFFSALSSLIFLSSNSDIRPELCGVFCSFEKEQARMAATDSFRLGEHILKIPGQKESIQFIIPSRTVTEVLRVFKDSQSITMWVSSNQVVFKTPERELVSRLIEGKYPDYRAIIPTSFTTRLYIKKDGLVRLLRAASVFSGKNNDVKITFSPEKGECIVESQNSDVGDHRGETFCEGSGKDLTISCNYQYLLDALEKLNSEIVSIEGNKEADPILLKESKGLGSQYLIMPLRSY